MIQINKKIIIKNMRNLKHIIPFSLFEGIEDKGRLSDKITGILNKQIKNELLSSQIYRGMSCWLIQHMNFHNGL
jgi:hypothetical protein